MVFYGIVLKCKAVVLTVHSTKAVFLSNENGKQHSHPGHVNINE
jgi:hypothetical protein